MWGDVVDQFVSFQCNSTLKALKTRLELTKIFDYNHIKFIGYGLREKAIGNWYFLFRV